MSMPKKSIKKEDLPKAVRPLRLRAKPQRRVDAVTFVDSVYYIVNEEIGGLKRKVQDGKPLSAAEAGKLVKYGDLATKLSREEREWQKQEENFQHMSDEELEALLPAAVVKQASSLVSVASDEQEETKSAEGDTKKVRKPSSLQHQVSNQEGTPEDE